MNASSEEGQANATFPVTISREYPPAPLVAVAAVVLDDAGRILMVERGRPPSKGMWALPGGLLDLGEPVRAGVAREVWEETGAKIEIVELVDLFEPIHRDAAGRIRYHYRCDRLLGALPRGQCCAGRRRRRCTLVVGRQDWGTCRWKRPRVRSFSKRTLAGNRPTVCWAPRLSSRPTALSYEQTTVERLALQ